MASDKIYIPDAPDISAMEYWQDLFDARTSWIPDASPNSKLAGPIRQIWDEEIDALHALLVKAKSRRNTLALPALLPTEVVVRVFEFLAPLSRRGRGKEIPSYVSVTHVCRFWRSAALSHAGLWSDIRLNEMQSWMIERVGLANLDVHGSLGEENVAMIADRISQIRTLDIQGNPEMVENLLSQISKPTSELRHVSFGLGGVTDSSHKSIFEPLLSKISSHVQTVALVWLQFPWEVNFSSLRSLDLYWYTHTGHTYTYSQMMLGLKNMPHLEKLDLRCFPAPTNHEMDLSVHLPHLRTLRLSGKTKLCFTLWTNLIIPPTTSITLEYDEPDESDHNQLILKLRKRQLDEGSIVFPHMQFHCFSSIQFIYLLKSYPEEKLSLSNGCYTISDTYRGPDICICLVSRHTVNIPSLTYDLATSAIISSLETFVYNDRCKWSSDQLINLFSRMPSLTQLELALTSSEVLDMLLRSETDKEEIHSPNSPGARLDHKPLTYFCKLKSLAIRDLHDEESERTDAPDSRKINSHTILRLAHWRNTLPEFDKVLIYEIELDADEISQIREIVPFVSYDGTLCSNSESSGAYYDSDEDDEDDEGDAEVNEEDIDQSDGEDA